jgi:5-deoxy-5-amino-3-dehydroquinate synthase
VVPPAARRAAIVTQAGIGIEVDPGIEHRTFLIGVGEETKTLATVEHLCRQWAQWGLNRADVVVAVGGGMVTDVAGFAAASYHRGVEVVHVSTTLLGQIDASIGGKTGVNLPEGKNLVGAYWQPRAVLCDTDVLASMPPREMRSGLGEMAKYHFLDDGSHGAVLLEDLALDEQIARCVAIKAAIVAGDEREGGRRATLNYGHTLAHALEIAGQFDLRHGEAVAIGLIYAAELARILGRIDDLRVDEHRRIVGGYDLPVDLPVGSDPDELVALFGRDKKAINGITFVLDGPDGVETVTGVDRAAMDAALAAMVDAATMAGAPDRRAPASSDPADPSGDPPASPFTDPFTDPSADRPGAMP